MNFVEKVRVVREKLFLSQVDLGKELGVSYATINRWEQGKTQPNWQSKKIFHELCEKNDIKFND